MKRFLLLALCLPTIVLAATEPTLPPIATIGDIRIGWDTMDKLDKMLGEGAHTLGARADSGRAWNLSSGHGIFADGNQTLNRREIIDMVIVDTMTTPTTETLTHQKNRVPCVRVSSDKFKFCGVVSLGMSSDEVKRKLSRILPEPKQDKGALCWRMTGNAKPGVGTFTSWEATLTFQNDKLVSIVVMA